LYETNLSGEIVRGDGVVRFGRDEDDASGGDGIMVVDVVGRVHAVLQEMERYAQSLETEFIGQAELLEPKEVLVNVFGKVATDELFAAVVEGADTILASTVAESRTLRLLVGNL